MFNYTQRTQTAITAEISALQTPEAIDTLEQTIQFAYENSEIQLAFYSKCVEIYAKLIEPENSEAHIEKLYKYLNKFIETMRKCQNNISIAQQPLNNILMYSQHINHAEVKQKMLLQIFNLSFCIKLFEELLRYRDAIKQNSYLSEITSVVQIVNTTQMSMVQRGSHELLFKLFENCLRKDFNVNGDFHQLLSEYTDFISKTSDSEEFTFSVFKRMLFLKAIISHTEVLCSSIADNDAIETIKNSVEKIKNNLTHIITPSIHQSCLIARDIYLRQNKEEMENIIIQLNGLIRISNFLTLDPYPLQICKSRLLIAVLKLNRNNKNSLKCFQICPTDIISPYCIFELQKLNIHFSEINTDAIQFLGSTHSTQQPTKQNKRPRGSKQVSNVPAAYTNYQLFSKVSAYLQCICQYIMGNKIQFPTIEYEATQSLAANFDKMFATILKTYNNTFLNLYCIDESQFCINKLFPDKEKEFIPILEKNKLDLLYSCIKNKTDRNFLVYCNKFIEQTKQLSKRNKSQSTRLKEIYLALAQHYLDKNENEEAILVLEKALTDFPNNALLLKLRKIIGK